MGSLIAIHTLAEKIFDLLYNLGQDLEIIDDFHVVTKKINKLLEQKEEKKINNTYDLKGDIVFSNVSIYIENKVWKKYNCKNYFRIL